METILQSNFGGGEIAPEFWNDKTLKQYPISLKTCRNFKIDRGGKLKKCPGTIIVPGSNTLTSSPRLIPFIIGPQESYILEFVDNAIYFIKDGEFVSPDLTAWSGSTTYVPGQTVEGDGSTYYYTAIYTSLQNLNIQPGVTTGWANYWVKSYLPGYSIQSPFTNLEAQDIKFRQVNGVLYIVHPNYPPQQIIYSNPDKKQPVFYCTQIPFTQLQKSNVFNMTATPIGQSTYSYKYMVTTVNAKTGEESYPGLVGFLGSQQALISMSTTSVLTIVSPVDNGRNPADLFYQILGYEYVYNNIVTVITSSAHGFPAGNSVTFFGITQTGTKNQNGQTVVIDTVPSTTSFTFSYLNSRYISGAYNPPGGQASTGTGGIAKPSTAITITAISKSNPCIITASSHGFLNGDIITLLGTGVFLLDSKPYKIGLIDSNNFVLQGIDSSDFIIPSSITGQAYPNILNTGLNSIISPTNTNIISWNSLDQQIENNTIFYNIYRNDGSGFGFIASTYQLSYIDIGVPIDLNVDPPSYNALFQTPGNYPSKIEVFQQRLMLASTSSNPLEFNASRTGFPKNFTDHQNIQSDDAIVQQTLWSESGSIIQDMIDFGFLVVFTDQHEFVFRGDSTGTITPEEINSTRQMFNGAAKLHPLKINKSIIFLQANTSIIRDLQLQITPYGMTYLAASNELTLYSKHLVEGYAITDWDFQKIYDSTIWAVRDDGILIGTPYNLEQGLSGSWFRRDTQGTWGNICCVQEGLETAVYITCERTQSDLTSKWEIERMSSDQWTDLRDANYLDGAIIVDGRNSTVAPTTTMTLSLTSGSTKWDGTQNLTLTASAAFFTNNMVGDWIFLEGQDVYSNGLLVTRGTQVKFQIETRTNSTVVTGTVEGTVPDGTNAYGTDGTIYTNMRSVALTVWGHATTTITGIPIGGPVAIVGDGMVQSNPYNLKRGETAIISRGTINIPEPAVVIIIGFPYFSDLETLNFDQEPKDSLINKKTRLKQAACMVNSTQGFWVGDKNPNTNPSAPQNQMGPIQNPDYHYGLIEAKIREIAGYDSSVDLTTGLVLVDFSGDFGYGSNLFIRSLDPIPCNFSAVGFSVDMPSIGK